MLISSLDGTIRVPSVIGVSLGSSGRGGIDLAQPREDLRGLEAHGRGLYVSKAKFPAELWPLGTVVCGPLQAVRR